MPGPFHPAESIEIQASGLPGSIDNTVCSEIWYIIEIICCFPNNSISDRAWCKLVLNEPNIKLKDIVEYYRTRFHIVNKYFYNGINVMSLEPFCLPFIQILNMMKYVHSLQGDTDAHWHNSTTWVPADCRAFFADKAHAYHLLDDHYSPPSTTGTVETMTEANSALYGDESKSHTTVATPIIQSEFYGDENKLHMAVATPIFKAKGNNPSHYGLKDPLLCKFVNFF